MKRTLTPLILLISLAVPCHADAKPRKPARRAAFTATAYCKKGETASGDNAHSGIVAADPQIIPIGSTVRVDGRGLRPGAQYTVQDAGVKGRRVDIFMPSCRDAKRFGKRPVRVTVVKRAEADARRQ